ncbi:MAG: VWA domain-containing protein [Odoribacter sp.]|nr:VWA domain-containing protein [Odoribacter sp.]
MSGYEFANLGYFILLIIPIPMIIWYILKERTSHVDLQFSSLRAFRHIKNTGKVWLRHVLFALKILAIIFIVVALARPQTSNKWQTYNSEGIDIMLALDISGSMLAQDFTPDRLEAAKEVAQKFVLERPQDRIGLVVFAGESFTQCPLTTDHAVLVNLLREVRMGMIEDGTAIGLGLANAINRLKDSPSPSKVVILLTDGVNNRGAIAPLTAAELAKTFGIRVYTIGVGTYGKAPFPVQNAFGGMSTYMMDVEIDEPVMKQISSLTRGQYFRATDNEKLVQIYDEIDKMEKSKMEVKYYSKKQERYFLFALIGMLLLITESLLRYTVLRKIP